MGQEKVTKPVVTKPDSLYNAHVNEAERKKYKALKEKGKNGKG